MRTDRPPSEEFILCICVIDTYKAVCHGISHRSYGVSAICFHLLRMFTCSTFLAKVQYCVTENAGTILRESY
jgi:hypothetical protein